VGCATVAGSVPEARPYRYVSLDRDYKFNAHVIGFLKSTGLKPKRTSLQAPWQNGIAERWIGSCRRELLDHVIALGESHLRGLIRDYVNYHLSGSDSRFPSEGHAEPTGGRKQAVL
jgi:transposase InsO family protein